MDALVDAGFKVLRYDLFGHGFSDRPHRQAVYTREGYERQLLELLDRLGIKPPVYLMGTSQGGSISAYFAVTHPEKVAKLALLAPYFNSFEGEAIFRILKVKKIGEYVMRLIGDRVLTNPAKGFYGKAGQEDLIAKLQAQVGFKGKKRAVLANMRGNALDDPTAFYAALAHQDLPVLLIWGKNDRSISGESMVALRRQLPAVDYHELDHAAHLGHYEFPEQINSLLIEFFRK